MPSISFGKRIYCSRVFWVILDLLLFGTTSDDGYSNHNLNGIAVDFSVEYRRGYTTGSQRNYYKAVGKSAWLVPRLGDKVNPLMKQKICLFVTLSSAFRISHLIWHLFILTLFILSHTKLRAGYLECKA